jgi:hypothetical protein
MAACRDQWSTDAQHTLPNISPPPSTHLAHSHAPPPPLTSPPPGPNMGGKSCFLRMCAVTAIMAHLGSYVPAASCQLSVCDAVLSRMGAADDISSGRSTFQEEMTNAAEMLNRATPRWVDGGLIAQGCLVGSGSLTEEADRTGE